CGAGADTKTQANDGANANDNTTINADFDRDTDKGAGHAGCVRLCAEQGGAARTNSAASAQSLIGFCVLGGVFAEGIDLAGDRLIGSIVVGVGLPQIGPVQDALRDYYTATLGAGFDYAYRYPGMNKVLQAAGRVIRTERDKGMVLLIDSRYQQRAYRDLFPPHWAHCRRVASAAETANALALFWGEEDTSGKESTT
ncbi:MAG: helicase C-terminal domain-containing protein, partial [Ruthenibacterium sp.]